MNIKFSPFVSIVIPTYNHANYIDKSLNSIINQTFKNWEAIVIDNHSTDGTEKILRKYTDPRIRYLKINNNGIIAKSRNLGIEVATGQWIAFLDSDDWWTNDKLEVCFNDIDEKVDFIYHDLELVNTNSKFFFSRKRFKGRELKKPVLKNLLVGMINEGTAICNSSVIVRKNILIKIGGISENKNLAASEDFNTWLRIAQITDQFKYLKKKLGYYLIHDASAQNKDLSIPHKEAVIDFMNLFNSSQKLNFEVKLKYMSACYKALKNHNSEARIDFMFVIKNGSFNLKLRSLLKIIFMIFK